MLKSFFRIAIRSFFKNKIQSFINIAGLSAGMFVTILIGLWIHDELTYDQYHQNYSRIAQVMQNQYMGGITQTGRAVPRPIEPVMKKNFGHKFKHIVMSSWMGTHLLSFKDKTIKQSGSYMDNGAPDMLTLKMVAGRRDALQDPSSILLSESAARALFNSSDVLGKTVKLDTRDDFKVAGVYEDLPYQTSFRDLHFIAPWEFYVTSEEWIKNAADDWYNNSFQLFVQLPDNGSLEKTSEEIRNAKVDRINAEAKKFKPELFLHPMSKWHLSDEFKDGKNTGGRIEYVWMFGVIGLFVLLLACINFMNLSTARSEKRAREVGVLKSIGCSRKNLVFQFFGESLLCSFLALILALLLVNLSLPLFNGIADKRISFPWTNAAFWVCCLFFSFMTGIVAGSYPALYLSSFKPVKVLKGIFRTPGAEVPRKVLVVVQFTVSVVLVIGTIVVFRQIQFTRNRPVGYSPAGLISVTSYSGNIHNHFEALRQELISSGFVVNAAEASSPLTSVNSNTSGFNWKGKNPDMPSDFGMIRISTGYGKTVGWKFAEGRDFLRNFASDTSAIVINEAAAKYTGLEKPVGELLRNGKDYRIIGVIKDMVMQSPYEPAKPTVFFLGDVPGDVVNIRIHPSKGVKEALGYIEGVYKKYSPETPFDYVFADSEYGKKFGGEERIGNLAGAFALLAIFISCLGLFGMAAFAAERRTKEIGVRKVLGATVPQLWRLLSVEFARLVILSFCIAAPLAYWLMHSWLQKYSLHADIPLWIFLLSGCGLLIVTLLTTSTHIMRVALSNPVKSLRSE
ncbi:ABC transporter permease [Pararcticibacter amylolyticus]|uniref:ABC transporter permease n=1 Tax=Pararcticibacter amylolyticus TaxID=2173175 RepID=A0A2U2PF39_9SPHI|nr:ABC transporter permease [Pararcticibacter amylolyticus]PWG79944.1 ABC transporter permease [Pararcticibacter amylolyticus]